MQDLEKKHHISLAQHNTSTLGSEFQNVFHRNVILPQDVIDAHHKETACEM